MAAHGGVLRAVPYRDDHNDLAALAAEAAAAEARLLYLANPDNPTGSFHGAGAVTAGPAASIRSSRTSTDQPSCGLGSIPSNTRAGFSRTGGAASEAPGSSRASRQPTRMAW